MPCTLSKFYMHIHSSRKSSWKSYMKNLSSLIALAPLAYVPIASALPKFGKQVDNNMSPSSASNKALDAFQTTFQILTQTLTPSLVALACLMAAVVLVTFFVVNTLVRAYLRSCDPNLPPVVHPKTFLGR